jgi:hypothetical protein
VDFLPQERPLFSLMKPQAFVLIRSSLDRLFKSPTSSWLCLAGEKAALVHSVSFLLVIYTLYFLHIYQGQSAQEILKPSLHHKYIMKALLIIASSLTLCFISSKGQKRDQHSEQSSQSGYRSQIITRNEYDSSPPAKTESPPPYGK